MSLTERLVLFSHPQIIGLGVSQFRRDSFNLFDLAIVLVSAVELVAEVVNGPTDDGDDDDILADKGRGGAMSAFRILRLARIFKVIRRAICGVQRALS